MGHFISDERLIQLGHQLLVPFAAYDFPSLYREEFLYHDPDPIDDLRSLEDFDLSEQLVMLFALARANDDEHQALSAVKKALPDGVGTIDENRATKVLTPREACNKITHAWNMDRLIGEPTKRPVAHQSIHAW